MVLKSANIPIALESPGRTSSGIRYAIWNAMFNRSHGDIYVYLELCRVGFICKFCSLLASDVF